MLQQEGEHGCVAVSQCCRSPQSVPLPRVDLQLVGPAHRHETVDEERGVCEEHILVVHPMENQQTIGTGWGEGGRRHIVML